MKEPTTTTTRAADRLTAILSTVLMAWVALGLASCSMTKDIPDDDQLYIGLTRIAYVDDTLEHSAPISQHIMTTKAEVEAALATPPNGALFGSSYHRVPWSWRLWLYNNFSNSRIPLMKLLAKSMGRKPVLMSQVNPALHASVARSVLRNNGFFRASVDYQTLTQRNPKKAKIAYSIHLDSLFTVDSIAYTDFPAAPRHIIDSLASQSLIAKGDPFSLSNLEAERTRLSTMLRNNGYYYYNTNYANFLADTVMSANRVQLQLKLSGDLPPEAMRQWYIGKTEVLLRRQRMEQMTDSLLRRHTTIRWHGRHSPIRPRVVLRNLKLRSGQLFSYDNYMQSLTDINATGVFSAIDFTLSPSSASDSLNLQVNCTFDKPYDFYIETTAIGRTIGRYGPQAKIGVTRRNAFRGAEKLDINLHGAYEWQRSGGSSGNSYQYGADVSVEFPRIIAPFVHERRRRPASPSSASPSSQRRRARFFSTPTTLAKVSTDVVRRPQFYKMHIVSGEWTYQWQPSEQHRHALSPLTVKYQFKNSHTDKFDSILSVNPFVSTTMEDCFIPKMRYTYTFTSPSTFRHPIRWETTVEESGNLVALWDLAGGKSWTQKDKTLFKNPYSQFVRVETDLTKTWTLGSHSSLVGHLNAGMIYSFGNSDYAPFTELFYAGGANSIRAFGVRGVGPGGYVDVFGDKQFSYVLQNGDIKFVGNLEYRSRLFGKLSGALFLDVGNVWNFDGEQLDTSDIEDGEWKDLLELFNYESDQGKFKPSRLFDQIAVGTGVGLRYDLGFLVLRLDWGLAIHAPYDTGKSGYFNVRRFHDAQTLHFAIGHPF